MMEQPAQNKMITQAPNEKSGWHFASDGIHKAAYIWAHTIEEAEKIYHKTKERITPNGSSVTPASEAQSTASVDGEDTE
jgi:hypothetical protein